MYLSVWLYPAHSLFEMCPVLSLMRIYYSREITNALHKILQTKFSSKLETLQTAVANADLKEVKYLI